MREDTIRKMYTHLSREASKLWDDWSLFFVGFNIRPFSILDESNCAWTEFTKDLTAPERIELNSFWAPHLTEVEMEAVLRHELAHARAGYRADHDESWEKACIEFGVRPDTYIFPTHWEKMEWTIYLKDELPRLAISLPRASLL